MDAGARNRRSNLTQSVVFTVSLVLSQLKKKKRRRKSSLPQGWCRDSGGDPGAFRRTGFYQWHTDDVKHCNRGNCLRLTQTRALFILPSIQTCKYVIKIRTHSSTLAPKSHTHPLFPAHSIGSWALLCALTHKMRICFWARSQAEHSDSPIIWHTPY